MVQKIIRNVVMVVALVIFGYVSYELTLLQLEKEDTGNVVNNVSSMFLQPVETGGNSEGGSSEEQGEISMNNTSDGTAFVFDYNLLLSYNSEAKGYIRQGNGEYIDYPILQHSDNDYYLTHMPDGTQYRVGSIFIDYRIEEGLEAKNCIVYGHRMGNWINNIMFGSLIWYLERDGYADAHPDFDIYVANRHYKYYVFACYETTATGSDVYQYAFASDEEFMEYVNKALERSTHKFPKAGEITPQDTILTLSTCTSHDKSKRTIIQLVRREEINDVKQN